MGTERVGRAGPTRSLFVQFRDGGRVVGYPLRSRGVAREEANHADSEKRRRYRAKLEENWNAKVRQLGEYANVRGHCNVPMRWKDNPALGSWVNKQRECYRAVLRAPASANAPPRISDARIAQLDALGLCWNVGTTRDGAGAAPLAERAWDDNARALAAYREEHGDCLVPCRLRANPTLANFVARAQKAFRGRRRPTPGAPGGRRPRRRPPPKPPRGRPPSGG